MLAIILAGGLGSRLKPFTEIIPKPLLPIGEKSVLEIQINQLKACGFDEVVLATNYKSEYIKNFFGDGSKQGIKLDVSKEEKPLGTCGPLSLLRHRITGPTLVMNGDILTNTNFKKILDFASSMNTAFTVVTKEVISPFEFGEVVTEGNYITEVREKPKMKFEILAGIYVVKPELMSLIPDQEYFGMDQLIKSMLEKNLKISKYFLKDYWLDIGRIENYQKAENDYYEHFESNNIQLS
jgi:NDP-sugar pyrophosphorylase family protein